MEILRQLEHRGRTLVRRQVGTVEQVLMHPYRTIDLALAAEEAARARSEDRSSADRP